MRWMVLAIASLGLVTDVAAAQAIYLNCKTSSTPSYLVRDLYAGKAPPTTQAFLDDLWNAGIFGFVAQPPTTWEVDFEVGIVSSDGVRDYHISETKKSSVTASFEGDPGTVFIWRLNRINGQVTLSKAMSLEDQAKWKSLHGRDIPLLWSWVQDCTASDKPAI